MKPRALVQAVACLVPLLATRRARADDIHTYTDKSGVVHLYNVRPHRRAGGRGQGALALPMVLLDPVIAESASRWNIPPELVKAVIQVESNFNPSAVSAKGAIGLMQLMPETARELEPFIGESIDPYDPVQNVRAGTLYLRMLVNRFGGDLNKVLAAYNAGPQAVERCGTNCVVGVPPIPETIDYVRFVQRAYQAYKAGAPAQRADNG